MVPEVGIKFKAEHRSHLPQPLAAAQPMTLGPTIQNKESMGDPELQGFPCEANPFGAAKAMGQQHRHMAGELAARALQHQR